MPLVTQWGSASPVGEGWYSPKLGLQRPRFLALLRDLGHVTSPLCGLGFPWSWQCVRQVLERWTAGGDGGRDREGIGAWWGQGVGPLVGPTDIVTLMYTQRHAAPSRTSCTWHASSVHPYIHTQCQFHTDRCTYVLM